MTSFRPSLDARGEEITDTEQKPAVARIPVKRGFLRVFTDMFPASVEAVYKSMVRWQDFVAAMADAGYSATHKGGSAVKSDCV